MLLTGSNPQAASTDADNDPPLRGRRAVGIRLRKESFGSIVYVPERDHFYGLDQEHTRALLHLGSGRGREVQGRRRELVATMATAGICETEPPTAQRAFYGRTLIGSFPQGIPAISAPMVVNCFTTAHCPLRCAYCHADDLMTSYRNAERPEWLDEVIRVAAATAAMVGVVTGGEPLSRPEKAARLLTALARDKAVVLDTSGVGDLSRLVPLLRQHNVHVRFSLDSAQTSINDRLRPINRRYLPLGSSSFRASTNGIELAIREGVACSVQTVVTARNSDVDGLAALRDLLLDSGVRTWALHVMVPAGKAASRPQDLQPGEDTLARLRQLVDDTASRRLPIDIRVTSTHRAPNSTLLVTAKGELAVQRPDGTGKEVLRVGRLLARRRLLRQFHRQVDPSGHASRYLNGTLDLYRPEGLDFTPELPAPVAVI